MADAPVCFIDTETLGLDPDVHPVWEVAIIRPDGSEWVKQIKVTERELALAHPIALDIGRFDERYVRGSAMVPDEAASFVRDMTAGCHLAGAVVSFDEERLRRLMWKHGLAPKWHYHLIDVEALAVGYLAGRATDPSTFGPPWKSDELTAALDIDIDESTKHTALGDARWAKAIYDRVMSL